MNIPVGPDRALSFQAPVCGSADHVLLGAEMDCVITFSACPSHQRSSVHAHGDHFEVV